MLSEGAGIGERLKVKGVNIFPLALYPAKFPWRTTSGFRKVGFGYLALCLSIAAAAIC
ncbi:hypothetical protein [Nostoc sp. ChiVER01]|uniref:hypothetical protein n=1 Tax=Nostoc sp. ChiVER01 TaxID=3075382 RepID=UPI002AD35FAA|nr:hypothetical protein [Nostoc sp. ChiVER01]MDZ8223844.1 hypothetical protein [Nostoc sp. ChiVER01]